ncbi:MAG: transcription termination factor NusA [Candidatus Liptonbacteria bacterium RIFCSPHIGHO2_01_FULL_57_28]|uniref:Transcription termination/antitermination protein NusA n=1 Tax=Candidatus Liptonbacteria bacterium RIFCSPHIGHO2_01_FULL_57_28 TaxID=1798647 RepID=A0A1G2C805_9BACT|nr:MAG: transcription termination factor NusA [Candidatus Liptonbacteria bacterium RIFCSPHIGHO2_01_FULL_57_28]
MNVKDILKAAKQVAEEKGLTSEVVIDAIESSLAAAYKREYGSRGEVVKAKMDTKTGEIQFWKVKTVVDESTVRIVEDEVAEESGTDFGHRQEEPLEEGVLPRYNPERHILLKDAKKEKKDATLGSEITFPLEAHEDFGRIAAQIAKQTVLQRLRESERESILNEWRGKEGQIVSGLVQRFERGNVYIDFGRAVGVMFSNESIPGEHYRAGERLRFYVLAVQEDTRLPGIILSRSHPKFVNKLFEMEVPEISDGSVEIKAITREPGSRTKVAVASNAPGVDPIGACVGQRGTRVMAVNNELGQEKIDIIEWAEEPERFIANALSPAKVESVEMMPRHEARVFVPEDQLSLAIGRGGQNVRMAARLTGWKIDVRSQTRPEEAQEGGVAVFAEGEADFGGDDEPRPELPETEKPVID